MPIIVKDFNWKQSDRMLFIDVPLRGIHHSKVDVFIAPQYLKLNFCPFIFELYLFKEIDECSTICSFIEEVAHFEMVKKKAEEWTQIETDIDDRAHKMKLKERAIDIVQVKTREALDRKIESKRALAKFSIEESIKENTDQMNKIKKLREEEKQSVLMTLVDWGKDEALANITSDIKPESDKKDLEKTKKLTQISVSKNNTKKRTIPNIRPFGTISVSFTDRILPTPSRESTAKDEDIWMKKLNDARRASGFISEDLLPEERNPQWCKDKGDELFKSGNYIGAINAYSHGIKLSDQLPSLYSNRAVTYFAMGHYQRCIEDCSMALELLVPRCEANLKSRVRCIVRRAAALTRIGMLNKAIDEMKYAIKLEPNDEKLKADLFTMERAWEQNPDSD